MTKYINNYYIEDYKCYLGVIDKETNKEICRSEIDTTDIPKLAKYRWGLDNKGYLHTGIKSKMVGLHRFLLDLVSGDGKVVDHIDRNIYNNRKSNLRLCSQAQNVGNSTLRRDNSSGYKGVCWHKRDKKWQAYIRKDTKLIHLGLFDIAENAAMAYNEAALDYFGEFAVLNYIKEN
jgi:hypothetical protein